ncbi:MAG TPA: dTMP kinase [Burkholderiales bacterium]|nr:dTMP kinase [Burkholderiales bacterium]
MNRGKFLSLEGIDGAGKSSHVEWLAQRLSEAGLTVVVTREPGGTPLGERLRTLLLNEPMDLRTETLLAFAARQEHLAQVITPALAEGKWVLSDRFTDATYAYQGGGRGLSEAKIAALENWVQEGLQPDLSFYFDVPAAVGIARRQAASAELDRFERERADFFERVRNAYLERAQSDPRRLRVIDGTQNLDQVRVALESILIEHLG